LEAIKQAGIATADLDLIMLQLHTNMIFPSTACMVQRALGAVNAASFDLAAACSGFVYGLNVARAFIESGIYKMFC